MYGRPRGLMAAMLGLAVAGLGNAVEKATNAAERLATAATLPPRVSRPWRPRKPGKYVSVAQMKRDARKRNNIRKHG